MQRQPNQKWNWFSNLHRQSYYTALIIIMFSILSYRTVQGQQVRCQLEKISDTVYAGLCKYNDSLIFFLNLTPPSGGGLGFWRGHSSSHGTSAYDPIFLEIRANGGTLGTVYRSPSGLPCGWYDIPNVHINNGKLEFSFNMSETSKPRSSDVVILRKAKDYFSDSSKWNREDKRTYGYIDCQPNSEKKSLFCALYAAQADKLGNFYGGPTFWALGQAIMRKKEYEHPMQEFNNDLTTSFNELHVIFDDAINRMIASLSTNDK